MLQLSQVTEQDFCNTKGERDVMSTYDEGFDLYQLEIESLEECFDVYSYGLFEDLTMRSCGYGIEDWDKIVEEFN